MSTSQTLLGLYDSIDHAVAALDALRAAGIPNERLDVLSDVPYPDGAFGEHRGRHRLPLFAFAGAAGGIVFGIALTAGTQLAYPLVTGGMPILAIPPMVNVVFETMMLGAISLTGLGVLFESRLPDFRPTPYDPRITEGMLGVIVQVDGAGDGPASGPAASPTAGLAAVERLLRDAGAVDVVTGGGSNRDGEGGTQDGEGQ